MTDDTGLLQHATFDVPNYRDGYCIDDNARALLLMTHDRGGRRRDVARRACGSPRATSRSSATRSTRRAGRFRNFLSYARTWHDEPGSDDSHGRALWALGARSWGARGDPGRKSLAGQLFHAALPAAVRFTSPRAWAYTLLGIDEYLQAFQGESKMHALRDRLAERLLDVYQRASHPDWPWFEDRVTYCNARLPQALIASGARMRATEMPWPRSALRSLAWLVGQPRGRRRATFAPIGSNGFHVRGGERATFDQQPVEACAMVSACLEAHADHGASAPLGDRAARVRLVPRAEPAAAVALRPHHRRLPRRPPRRPDQREPGRRVDAVVLLALLEMRAAGDRRAHARPARDVSPALREPAA